MGIKERSQVAGTAQHGPWCCWWGIPSPPAKGIIVFWEDKNGEVDNIWDLQFLHVICAYIFTIHAFCLKKQLKNFQLCQLPCSLKFPHHSLFVYHSCYISCPKRCPAGLHLMKPFNVKMSDGGKKAFWSTRYFLRLKLLFCFLTK